MKVKTVIPQKLANGPVDEVEEFTQYLGSVDIIGLSILRLSLAALTNIVVIVQRKTRLIRKLGQLFAVFCGSPRLEGQQR